MFPKKWGTLPHSCGGPYVPNVAEAHDPNWRSPSCFESGEHAGPKVVGA